MSSDIFYIDIIDTLQCEYSQKLRVNTVNVIAINTWLILQLFPVPCICSWSSPDMVTLPPVLSRSSPPLQRTSTAEKLKVSTGLLSGRANSAPDHEKGGSWLSRPVLGPATAVKPSEAAALEDVTLASVAPYARRPTMKSCCCQLQLTAAYCRSDREAMAAEGTGPEQPRGVPCSEPRYVLARSRPSSAAAEVTPACSSAKILARGVRA